VRAGKTNQTARLDDPTVSIRFMLNVTAAFRPQAIGLAAFDRCDNSFRIDFIDFIIPYRYYVALVYTP
jgi:hypothetical protein